MRELGQDGLVIFSYEWGGLRTLLDTVAGFFNKKVHTLLPHRAPKVGFYLQETTASTEEGFPVYPDGLVINSEVTVMMQAKLREGINRIHGNITIQDMKGRTVEYITSIDLQQSERFSCSFIPGKRGRYRMMLSGYMELSTGQEKPFVTKSFPFEID